MKRVLVRSIHDAFEYVMQHYYPFGLRDQVERDDTYAVISIQDGHCGGFGLQFTETEFCKGVLTLCFDDLFAPAEGAVMFDDAMAQQIIDFILANRHVDTLLIHCYAGQSRSRAVGAFAVKMLGGNPEKYLAGSYNSHVYRTLLDVLEKRS